MPKDSTRITPHLKMVNGCAHELHFYLDGEDDIALARRQELNSNPNAWTIHASLEVEFLVARKRLDKIYADSAHQNKFVCGATDEPAITAMGRIKAVLEQKAQTVDLCLSVEHARNRETDLVESRQGVFQHWLLCPAEYARATLSSPEEYKWTGLKLRTPMAEEKHWQQDASSYIELLEGLKKDIAIHVNSTCHLNVFIQPGPGVMDKEFGQKVTTLVWITEGGFLSQLCPPRTTSTICSECRLTLAPNDPPEDVMPIMPHNQMPIQNHLPQLLNDRDQALNYHIWRADGIRTISNYLLPNDAISDIGFNMHVYRSLECANPGQLPTLEFRYGLWHPYKGYDTTKLWLRLCIKYVHACNLVGRSYKMLVRGLDRLIYETRDDTDSISRILFGMGLEKDDAEGWQRIVKCYQNSDDALSPEKIDAQGVLE